MNTTKKITGAALSLLLALSLITGIISPAFAADAVPAADDTEDCVKWEVNFDKARYFLFDKVTATVKYTNTSDKYLFSAFAAESEAFEILSHDFDAKILGAGETAEAKIVMQLSSGAPDINFFSRFFLKIRDLFRKGEAFGKADETKSVYEAAADFGWDGRQSIKFCLNYEMFDPQNYKPPEENEDENGGGDREPEFFEEISAKDAYTLKFVIKSTADGQTTSMPVVMAKDEDRLYIEATAPVGTGGSMPVKVYINGDKARAYIPTLNAYMDIPAEEIREFSEESRIGIEKPDESGYKSTFMTSIGSKTYKVDIYETGSGTLYYYFEGTKLYKIEQKSGKGPQTVVEITEFTESADSSLFEEPKGYINLSDLVKSN